MAITKLLHMKQSGQSNPAKHLQNAINYVLNPEKTQNGLLVGAGNCNVYSAYEDMINTKKQIGKTTGRQGYHFIISFLPGEVVPEIAMEVIDKFAKEYLGDAYEYVYAVHDDTDHTHAHLIFNSVNRITRNKYHYKDGDWEREIQPITNKLCREYGLSEMSFEREDGRDKGENKSYNKWQDEKRGHPTWDSLIKEDIDRFIEQSSSYEEFLSILIKNKYEVKDGKHLSVKPLGKGKSFRTHQINEHYAKEEIEKRIKSKEYNEQITYKEINLTPKVKEVKLGSAYLYKSSRPRLSKYQRMRIRKLYRTGRMKKKTYSQAWKYRKDILRLEELKKQYKYIFSNNIRTSAELEARLTLLNEKNKSIDQDRKMIYIERKPYNKQIQLLKELRKLEEYVDISKKGYKGFSEEIFRYQQIKSELLKSEIPIDVLEKKMEYFDSRLDEIKGKKKALYKEKHIVKKIERESTETAERKTSRGKTRIVQR